MNNKTIPILQIGTIAVTILTIIINSLANIIPIGGNTTAELSDNIPNLFVPAGITFAIWGVIYVLILVFSFYLAKDFFQKEKTTKKFWEKISFYFICANVANSVWIFLWHYEQVVYSLLVIILLFFSLLIIYIRLHKDKEHLSLKEKLCVHVPISVYIGWITVATIANVTAALVTINWDGFGIDPVIWTYLIILVATLLTILVLATKKDYAYTAVILWALLGIYIKRSADDIIFGMQQGIAYLSIGAIIVLILIALLSYFDILSKFLPKK